MSKYEIHPAAELFPLMSDEELQGLIADIRENGQREPATFWNGKLIDGRNRAIACERIGIELDACELDSETDPVSWVLSHNLHRRHLTPSQKAMVAQRLKELYAGEAVERKREGGKAAGNGRPKKDVENLPQPTSGEKSRDKAAAAVGISGKLVDAADKVVKKGTPELQAAVTSGKVSVSRAAKIAEAPKEEQAALIGTPPPKITKEEPPLKRSIENATDKLVIARWLFDSCTEAQKAQISIAWNDWWKEAA